MYQMTVKDLTPGTEVQIDGLGLFGNGTYEITDEQHRRFRQLNPNGKTLLQAFKGHKNVDVQTEAPTPAPAKPAAADDKKKGGDN
jgi:hypothetical protein